MLSVLDKIDFYERYDGLMSIYEIAKELKTDVNTIRSIRKEFSSKCWTCRNACNGNNCSWVNTGIYPPYVTIGDDGIITGCLNYECG